MKRNILICSAWPYANGSLHLGHIAGLLPADVLARYFRLREDNVLFVSAATAARPLQPAWPEGRVGMSR